MDHPVTIPRKSFSTSDPNRHYAPRAVVVFVNAQTDEDACKAVRSNFDDLSSHVLRLPSDISKSEELMTFFEMESQRRSEAGSQTERMIQLVATCQTESTVADEVESPVNSLPNNAVNEDENALAPSNEKVSGQNEPVSVHNLPHSPVVLPSEQLETGDLARTSGIHTDTATPIPASDSAMKKPDLLGDTVLRTPKLEDLVETGSPQLTVPVETATPKNATHSEQSELLPRNEAHKSIGGATMSAGVQTQQHMQPPIHDLQNTRPLQDTPARGESVQPSAAEETDTGEMMESAENDPSNGPISGDNQPLSIHNQLLTPAASPVRQPSEHLKDDDLPKTPGRGHSYSRVASLSPLPTVSRRTVSESHETTASQPLRTNSHGLPVTPGRYSCTPRSRMQTTSSQKAPESPSMRNWRDLPTMIYPLPNARNNSPVQQQQPNVAAPKPSRVMREDEIDYIVLSSDDEETTLAAILRRISSSLMGDSHAGLTGAHVTGSEDKANDGQDNDGTTPIKTEQDRKRKSCTDCLMACTKCSKSIRPHYPNMTKHVLSHSREKKFGCPACGYEGCSSTTVKNHIASKHSSDIRQPVKKGNPLRSALWRLENEQCFPDYNWTSAKKVSREEQHKCTDCGVEVKESLIFDHIVREHGTDVKYDKAEEAAKKYFPGYQHVDQTGYVPDTEM